MIIVVSCIWEVPGSDLSRHADYPEALRGFPRYLKANGGIVAQTGILLYPSVAILPLDSV